MEAIDPTTGLIDHAAFDRLVSSQLPDVAADIDLLDRSRLHLEMAAVARATGDAIARGDMATATAHLRLMDHVLSKAAPEVENAITVSYLESVFLWEERPEFLRARKELPARLAQALLELEARWAALAAAHVKR
jgi:hypothetical protein